MSVWFSAMCATVMWLLSALISIGFFIGHAPVWALLILGMPPFIWGVITAGAILGAKGTHRL